MDRIQAVLRYSRDDAHRGEGSEYHSADFRLILLHGDLKDGEGNVAQLTPAEISLLAALVRNAGEIISREELLRDTGGGETSVLSERAVDVYVSRLRRKLRGNGRGEIIQTHRPACYILNTEVIQHWKSRTALQIKGVLVVINFENVGAHGQRVAQLRCSVGLAPTPEPATWSRTSCMQVDLGSPITAAKHHPTAL